MSPRVLTTGATITCPHGGVGTTVPTSMAWTVGGMNVVRANDTGTLTCPFIVPCVGYTLRSMGLNATQLEGQQVVLETDFQQSQTGLPLQIADTHTTIDDSTPAPLPPPGQDPPPGDPALLDLLPPVVVAAPPAGAFSVTTSMPATLPFTFTLNSAFPLSWSLVLLNTVALTSVPLTGGAPGAVVVPSGGQWSTPSLTVTATLSAAFMTALGPGPHDLYMTGVSQRGMSAHARATLTVSA